VVAAGLAARVVHRCRAVVTGQDAGELLAGLDAVAAGVPVPAGTVTGTAVTGLTATIFGGHGSWRAGTGSGLYAAFPVFARAVEETCALAEEIAGPAAQEGPSGWLLDRLLSGTGMDGPGWWTHPALLAVQAGLWRLLCSWDVRADLIAGHSAGEIAAAHAAGVLSLADAVTIAVTRGQLMQELAAGGAMITLAATERETEQAIAGRDDVSIAAVNNPGSVVISGAEEAVRQVADQFAGLGRRVRNLRVPRAYHSHLIDPVLAPLAARLAGLAGRAPVIPLISGLTGREAGQETGTAAYWARHAREPVRFAAAVATMTALGAIRYAELSPAPALSPHIAAAAGPGTRTPPAAIPLLRPPEPEPVAAVTAAARLYVHGAVMDWAALTGPAPRPPLDLPPYPFQHERYWPDPAPAPASPATGTARPAVRAATITWTPVAAGDTTITGTWLALISPGQDQADLISGLAAAGAGATLATVEIPDDAEGAQLAELLRAAHRGPLAGLVSFLALGRAAGDVVAGVPRGLAQVQLLVQALGEAGLDAPLWCVTSGAVRAGNGDEAPCPDQAMIWGFGRVAALESPRRWGGLIDLPAGAPAACASSLAAALAGKEDQVAVRGSVMFARRLRRSLPDDQPGLTPAWWPGQTVLITGGTGALGSHVARALARDGARHLVLASRSGEKARDAITLRDELSELGAKVTVAGCDVADKEALAELIGRLAADGSPVTDVVHAAGAGQSCPLDEMSLAETAGVLRAKTAGAVNLDELLGGEVGSFVLFSSIAGVWGSGGQAAYAAANAYLDALAERRRASGHPATAIAWGPWDGAGMAAGTAAEQVRKRGVHALSPDAAVAAMREIAASGEATAVVADVDWPAFAAAFTSVRPSPLLAGVLEPAEVPAADVPGPDSGAELRAQLAAVPEADRHHLVLRLVLAEIATVLRYSSVSQIEPDRAFRELGFDSLAAVELRQRLVAASGQPLPATLVFDYPTPLALASYVLGQIRADADDQAADDPEDVRLRHALNSIPLARLREAGLADVLLAMAGGPAADGDSADEDSADAALDDLDADELVRRALGRPGP
jgi:candicidin polyketide synthase FscE